MRRKRSEFCVRQVVYHLCSAEMWQELFKVVSDVEWLLARAQMDPLGLVLDLEHAAKQKSEKKSEFDQHSVHLHSLPQLHNRTVKLMAQALRMDLQELQHDYRSVSSQLVGRLIGYESESEVL